MNAKISIRRMGWRLALAALAFLAAMPVSAQTMTPVSAAPGDGAGCLAWLTAPMSNSGGPLCGSCAGQCRSDGLCKGKLAGDLCDNTGGTCQIVGGCGLSDCCKCTNALLAAVAPGAVVAWEAAAPREVVP
jgi:hypothetical protein